MSSLSENQKTNVLVVDDQEVARVFIRECLKDEGYEVFEATNGKDGEALCRDQKMDMIITDIIMPEQEGIETICKIREEYPGMKVVAISGGDQLYLDNALELGADNVLKKPFLKKDLLETIARTLSGDGAA